MRGSRNYVSLIREFKNEYNKLICCEVYLYVIYFQNIIEQNNYFRIRPIKYFISNITYIGSM